MSMEDAAKGMRTFCLADSKVGRVASTARKMAANRVRRFEI